MTYINKGKCKIVKEVNKCVNELFVNSQMIPVRDLSVTPFFPYLIHRLEFFEYKFISLRPFFTSYLNVSTPCNLTSGNTFP